MMMDNGVLKKLSREDGKKKRRIAERTMLLNASDIKIEKHLEKIERMTKKELCVEE